jgi:O-acetyl-ADP-ribose deacetylase (regulator of RNase III)
MIHEVKGDILLSHAQVIAHAIAPHDRFEHGLALSLREQWPAMVRDYQHFWHAAHPKLGDTWVWSGAMSKHIINLLVNEMPPDKGKKPRHATTEHVDHALRGLRHLLESERFASLALPRLATGAGGLDWNVVRPLINHHLSDSALPIYIYIDFEKGMQAVEPGLSHNEASKEKNRLTGQ